MLYLGGIGLAFFLDLLLLSKSKKTVADKILAGWLFIITAHLLLFYFHKMELYPQLLGLGIPFPLAHGPFLYLYTLALTNRALSTRSVLLHFLPFIAVLIYVIPFLALPTEQKIFVFENDGAGYETFNLINSLSIMASGVLYVILSTIVLRKHRNSIADQYSYTEKINLEWLRYLVYWIGVIWILVIFGNDDWVFGAVVLFIIFIGFFGIRQVGIFHSSKDSSQSNKAEANFRTTSEIKNSTSITDEAPPDNSDPDDLQEYQRQDQAMQGKRKYQKSGLSADASLILHRQLAQMMSQEKLYQRSELSLTELAERLNTQPNYLSQVINEQEGKNFYDYINTLRIEEFKRVAISPASRKYTLVALAQLCGFNSKSSFNRYFKKATGQSPSEFMVTVSETEK